MNGVIQIITDASGTEKNVKKKKINFDNVGSVVN